MTLFAPSLKKWVGIYPWDISPTMFSISFDARCICRTFPHNYRQNNGRENQINTWSSALILTRMDKSLPPVLLTSNLAQPGKIRSLWDPCKVWISLAWPLGTVLHPLSSSSYGKQKSHRMEENARHDGMVIIFLRTLWWKFILGCYWMVSRHQSTREATVVHMPGPYICLVTWFSWKYPPVPLSARLFTARRDTAPTGYPCAQELKSAPRHFLWRASWLTSTALFMHGSWLKYL